MILREWLLFPNPPNGGLMRAIRGNEVRLGGGAITVAHADAVNAASR